MNKQVLLKHLWGEFYFIDKKTYRIGRNTKGDPRKTLFVTLVLEPIWNMYSCVWLQPDMEKRERMLTALQITLTNRENNTKDKRTVLATIMRKWLPLAISILRMVVRSLPNPKEAAPRRMPVLFPTITNEHPLYTPLITSSFDGPLVAFVSKVISCPISCLSNGNSLLVPEGEEVLVSLTRVYSGRFTADTDYFLLGPKYDASVKALDEGEIPLHATPIPRNTLLFYKWMGRELVSLSEPPCAGDVIGIVGLGSHVLKTATLSSTLVCPSMSRLPFQARPIVRVAVEPQVASDFPILQKGLQLLYRSDPTVEINVQETGEHVIIALGELHLDCLLKDLRTRFAKIPIHVSEPLVGFRETIVSSTTTSCTLTTPDKTVSLTVMAVPIPSEIVLLLEEGTGQEHLCNWMVEHGWDNSHYQHIASGPKGSNTNVLLVTSTLYNDNDGNILNSMAKSITTGFQLATASGPVCGEPMYGIAFVLTEIILEENSSLNENNVYGPISGQIIGTMKNACRSAMKEHSIRLVEPIYHCTLQCPAETLGKCYGVLRKRRATILSEEITEGTSLFTIESYLPVIESLGFSNALLSTTSGTASNPQLIFAKWQILDIDPFFQPSTNEEKEIHGDIVMNQHNIIRQYIDTIRRRKGMAVEEKIVIHAEKQRTLTRNK